MNRTILLFGVITLLSCSKSSSSPSERERQAILFGNSDAVAAWKNPILKFDGRIIRLEPGGKEISRDDVISALISLPRDAWPQGRTVGVELVMQDGGCLSATMAGKINSERVLDLLRMRNFKTAHWQKRIAHKPGQARCE